jgi:hypothetical protein
MFRIEHNVETGEIIEIPLTESEIKEMEKAAAEIKAQVEKQEAEVAAKAAAKAALLERLGITEEEAKLLLG